MRTRDQTDCHRQDMPGRGDGGGGAGRGAEGALVHARVHGWCAWLVCMAGVHGHDVRPLGTVQRVLRWLRAEPPCDPAGLPLVSSRRSWSQEIGASPLPCSPQGTRTRGGRLRGCTRDGAGPGRGAPGGRPAEGGGGDGRREAERSRSRGWMGGRGRAGFVAGLGGRDGHQLRTPRRSPGEPAVPSLVLLGVSL